MMQAVNSQGEVPKRRAHAEARAWGLNETCLILPGALRWVANNTLGKILVQMAVRLCVIQAQGMEYNSAFAG